MHCSLLSLGQFRTPNYSCQKLGNCLWQRDVSLFTCNPSPKLLTAPLNISQIHTLHFQYLPLTLPRLLHQPPLGGSSFLQAIFHREDDSHILKAEMILFLFQFKTRQWSPWDNQPGFALPLEPYSTLVSLSHFYQPCLPFSLFGTCSAFSCLRILIDCELTCFPVAPEHSCFSFIKLIVEKKKKN